MLILQMQEFEERQKKIADMEAQLQDFDEHLATQQKRLKQLHVSTRLLAAISAHEFGSARLAVNQFALLTYLSLFTPCALAVTLCKARPSHPSRHSL